MYLGVRNVSFRKFAYVLNNDNLQKRNLGLTDEYDFTEHNFLANLVIFQFLKLGSNDLAVRYWITTPGDMASNALGGFMVNSDFYPSEVYQMSTRNSWVLGG